MSFPFEQLKAETLRSIVRDLEVPPQVSVRKDDMISYLKSVNQRGLAETRESFVVPERSSTAPKRKLDTPSDAEASSTTKRTRQTAEPESTYAYGTRNGGKRKQVVPASVARRGGRKPHSTVKKAKTTAADAETTQPQEEGTSASNPTSPTKKSSRTPKKTSKAIGWSSSKPGSSIQHGQEPAKEGGQANGREEAGQNHHDEAGAIVITSQVANGSELDADGSRDGYSDKENVPSGKVDTVVVESTTILGQRVPQQKPV